jgi:hypothetical protein
LGLNPGERIEPYTSKEGWECRAYENLTARFEMAVKDDVMRLSRVE